MIFVSIAAYRDPELWPTVQHALATAKHPAALRFAICLQDEEHLLQVPAHLPGEQIQLLPVPYQQSKGCCWARAELQRLYAGQEWVLQTDSHHRFAQDWDAQLIDMVKKLETEHPMEKIAISSYLPPYEPSTWPPEELVGPLTAALPCKIVATEFSPDWATVHFAPRYFRAQEPQRSAFVSAHFLFARGKLLQEVPYDAQLYFAGEEDTLALRLFTHGWAVYAPHITLAYHYYTRKDRRKHWEDVADWWKINDTALDRIDAVLAGAQCGSHPVEEYWHFSGINHALQTIQPWARHGYTALHLSPTPTTLWVHSEGYFKRKRWGWKENNGCRFELVQSADHIVLCDAARKVTLTLTPDACLYESQVLYTGRWIALAAPK